MSIWGSSAFDKSVKFPFFIALSVLAGFKRVSSSGRPPTKSVYPISIESNFVLISAKSHLNRTAAIPEPGFTASPEVHLISTGDFSFSLPEIK